MMMLEENKYLKEAMIKFFNEVISLKDELNNISLENLTLNLVKTKK
jgi:hypothetical protein